MGMDYNVKTKEATYTEDIPEPVDLDFLANQIRQERNQLLTETDFTQLADCPLNEEQKQAYAVYRQALRDLPEQEGFPLNVVYPIKPT